MEFVPFKMVALVMGVEALCGRTFGRASMANHAQSDLAPATRRPLPIEPTRSQDAGPRGLSTARGAGFSPPHQGKQPRQNPSMERKTV
jgi:hypothetical protein